MQYLNSSQLNEQRLQMQTKKNILVTGANGFLGRHVIARLVQSGEFNVRAVVRDRQRVEGIDRHPIEIVETDLTEPVRLAEALRDQEIIVHLAASSRGTPTAIFASTVNATENLFRSIQSQNRHIEKFIFVSSFAVYGVANLPANTTITEESPLEKNWNDRDAYSKAKIWQELVVREKARELGLNTIILRPGSIFGKGGNLLSNRVIMRLPGTTLHLQVGRKTIVPLSYVENCAEAIILAVQNTTLKDEIINIVDDDLPTQAEYLAAYENLFGKIRRKIYVPYPAFRKISLLFEYLQRRSKGNFPDVFSRYKVDSIWKPFLYSNNKLKKTLGWRQRYSLVEALQKSRAQ